jgi:hypothetical protein
MTAEALHIAAHRSRRIARAMLLGMRSLFSAPISDPHGEEQRSWRGVSNHEANAEVASCLSR